MKHRKALLLIIPLLLIGTCNYLLNSRDQEGYLITPRPGDIYVFEKNTDYYPYKLIHISKEALYFHKPNYSFNRFKPEDINAYKTNPMLFSSDTVLLLRADVQASFKKYIGDRLTHIGRY